MREDLKEDWEKVQSFDMSEIARMFAWKHNVPYSYTYLACEEMRKYLFMCKHRPQDVKVGLAANIMDYVWHYFLICTPECKDFGENYLGRITQHNPVKYWAEGADEGKEYPQPMHFQAAIEYEKIFGEKVPGEFWTGIPQEFCQDRYMPGGVSWNAQLSLADGGWKYISEIEIGDEIIGPRSEVTKVKGISCWGSTDKDKYIKFSGAEWFISDTLPMLAGFAESNTESGGESVVVKNKHAYNKSLSVPIPISLSDRDYAVLEIDVEEAKKNSEKFKLYRASGMDEHSPKFGTEMYLLFTEDGGFRIKYGPSVLTPKI